MNRTKRTKVTGVWGIQMYSTGVFGTCHYSGNILAVDLGSVRFHQLAPALPGSTSIPRN